MKKPAVKEEKQEVAAEPSSAQKQKKQDEVCHSLIFH